MDKLVNRFLSWPLPESVCADLIASKPGEAHRSGTNLLSAIEAKQMLEHVVGDELDRLHAEVASLKEELAATQSVGLRYARENADLTQQLAAANEERDEAGVVAHDSECAMMDSNENFCTCGAHDSVSSWSPTPSAQAIETAAIIRCAEVAYVTIRANLGFSVEAEATKQSILALIPQDRRTQLEEFGMKVATETRSAVLINTREDLFTEDSSLRAIVTNLIGADLPEADKEKS